FASIGLPDITAANANLVIGPYNGGGVQVIYDTDGKILQNVLGAPPSVLGIATPEWADPGTTVVTESWVVLNGKVITANTADAFKGVVTHEFGHSIGLAHSQTNGAIVYYGDSKGPAGCGSLPYSGAPTVNDIETMYPVISINTPGAGAAQSTVDVADDMIAI